MQKNALIAILLSFVVFFGYTKAVEFFYPDYAKNKTVVSTSVSQDPMGAAAGVNKPTTETTSPLANQLAATPVAKRPSKTTSFKYPNMLVHYSETDASIPELRFNHYPDKEGDIYRFIIASNSLRGIGAVDVVMQDGEAIALPTYQSKRVGNEIISTAQSAGLEFKKSWKFAKVGYTNAYSFEIKNTTDEVVRISYRMSAGSSPVTHNTIDQQYTEANWLTEEKLHHIRKPKVDKPKTLNETLIAASMKNRHFSSLFKPEQTKGVFFGRVEAYDSDTFGSYLIRSEAVLKPGQTLQDVFTWFAGPNRVEDLEPIGLGRIVNFGKLDAVAKLVLGGLHMIHGVAKNYGLAIILLTILTNIIFMPLTRTSFMSMRRMQLVQPQMTKLREKYKDNPSKLNTETMALYKKHKVNPMGGCLPMVLQMPIFMGLYVSLSKAPELLGGKFLWVSDLASPDQVPLPFTLPVVGDSIHLLPLIMVGAMVVQQRLSSASMGGGDPNMAKQQKIMMTVMPIMFGFIFYQMPSGLVIYWLTNTVMMSSYQAYLKKRTPTLAATPKLK